MSQKYTNNITATTTPTTIPLESPHHYPHTQGLSLKTKTTVNYKTYKCKITKLHSIE